MDVLHPRASQEIAMPRTLDTRRAPLHDWHWM
jgi:hypothetical protein